MRKPSNRLNLVIDTLEECPEDDLKFLSFREQFWIATLRETGHRLLNVSDGGTGITGYVFTDKDKEKMSKAQKGRKGPFAGVTGPAHPMYGWVPSKETRELWSKQRKGSLTGEKNPNFGKFGPDHPAYGIKRSEETKQKCREAKLGSKNPNFGKVYTDEERRIMSEKTKGKPMPSSRRSAHTRYHTNMNKISDKCKYCNDDRGLTE